jgi:hypothetical protein
MFPKLKGKRSDTINSIKTIDYTYRIQNTELP